MEGGVLLMKKCVSIGMLLMLVLYLLLINPSQEIAQHSFNYTDEPVITSVDTITSSDVITESIQTILHKWQIKFLFSTTNFLSILRGSVIPFKFINDVILCGEVVGFICVVHHQSNYLP